MADAQIYCQANRCRFPHAHTTSAHKCGRCDAFGHGQMECGNPEAEGLLVLVEDTLLPHSMQCNMSGCMNQQTHTRESHHCHHCFRQDHGERDCIISEIFYYHGKYTNLEYNLRVLDNIFFKEPSGMGSIIYIRKKEGILKFLVMHSDNWGQYGDHTSDIPRLNKFIQGLREVNDNVVAGFSQGSRRFGVVPVAAMDPTNPDELPISFSIGDQDRTDVEVEQGDHLHTETQEILDDMWNEYVSHAFQPNSVKCPLCRTMNEKSKIKQIKGLSDECSVCLNNSVSLYFPKCEHACVCQECFDQL